MYTTLSCPVNGLGRLRADCIVYTTPAMLHAEEDGGKRIQLIMQAALGERGAFVALEDLLSSDSEADNSKSRHRIVIVEDGATKRRCKSLPPNCEVWLRKQFRKAIIQQSFSHQKAFMVT
jgi:hypothetical protein